MNTANQPNENQPAPAATQTNQPAPAPAAPANILEQGKPTAAPDSYDWIAEKYHVKKEDGTFDLEASARKVSEAYKHLEQRFGSGDAPPKTADEYDIKVEADGFNFDEFKADPESQSFLKSAHAKGMTNEQLNFVLSEFYKRAPQLVAGAAAMDADTASQELRNEWKNDADFKTNISAAYRAFNAYASEADKAKMNEIGNNPIVIRLLANIGREMKEDAPVTSQTPINTSDFDTKAAELRTQLSALPAHDPKRKQVQAQLDAMYEQRYGSNKQMLGGGKTFSSVA